MGTPFLLQLPQPLLDLLQKCEVNCVAACCGLDAFDFDAEHLQPWLRQHGSATAFTALDQASDVVRQVAELPGTIWSDEYEFNTSWEPNACRDFLRNCWAIIVQAITEHRGHTLMRDAWITSAVHAIASVIDADRAFDRLPILADALQDAGCEDADILSHCRSGGPHVRGCWVVDLVLGKS